MIADDQRYFIKQILFSKNLVFDKFILILNTKANRKVVNLIKILIFFLTLSSNSCSINKTQHIEY